MAKKIKKGKALQELVKGSMDYTMAEIRNAFRVQFPWSENSVNYYIAETFADYVLLTSYSGDSPLKVDEFYKVSYSASGDSYVFAGQDEWEVVELSYQLQTAAITESRKKSGQRFEERIDPGQVALLEARDEKKGTRRIRINNLMVADEINGNGRLYSESVIGAMVSDWEPHLRESRGQGRLMVLTGEVEHPSDKGKKRPEFLETVVRWDTLDWDGKRLNVEGDLILTSKGRDVEILMEAGVNPGGSIRGIGASKIKKVDGEKIEEVQWAVLNAADLVGDPSFINSADLQESKTNSSMEDEMDLEKLLALLKEHPEAFAGITEAQVKAMGEQQRTELEETVRKSLGLEEGVELGESLKSMAADAKAYKEAQTEKAIADAIEESCKDLKYGETFNGLFRDSLLAAAPKSPEAVGTIAEALHEKYGALSADSRLKKMGFERAGSMQVVGSVLEGQTGTPEYARAAFELTESYHRRELTQRRDLREAVAPGEIFTQMLLEKFDKDHQHHLMLESRMLQEAEQTSDLNLPYSVSRAIIEEVTPMLVALGIFDVGLMSGSDERVFYEEFAGETGYTGTVTDEETVAAAAGTWVELDNQHITNGTFVLTTDPAGTTYDEGDDYVVDYLNGRYMILAAGDITAADDLLADYSYTALAKGEMAEIERGKVQLSSKVLTAKADRLADQISNEAILFSQSQLGWNAIIRTMSSLVSRMRIKIDGGLLNLARAAVMSVASNSGGTWTNGTDSLDVLMKYIGYAKVKVRSRYYPVNYILASEANADEMSNWDGFKTDGFSNAVLNAAGFAGSVKGLPLFSSTEMPDSEIVVGSRELVIHRIFRAMLIKGPYQSRGSNNKLVGAEEYYAEEFNASDAPVANKGAFVKVA